MEGFSDDQLEKLDRLRAFGTDQFNRRSTGTFLDATNAATKGLGPPVHSRFSNLGTPE